MEDKTKMSKKKKLHLISKKHLTIKNQKYILNMHTRKGGEDNGL